MTEPHNIYSVQQLTLRLQKVIEGALPFVWVSGEVTNVSRPGSGHVYFSLRDGDTLLGCVWFRGRQRAEEAFDPLTGEVYTDGPKPSLARTLRDGEQVVCAGKVSVYGPRGQYQLLVELAHETGRGELLRKLEALKTKLAAQGWFARERKRDLPAEPMRVAVLTAPSGAAIRDFVRVAEGRGLGANIRLVPVPVQGVEAAPRLIQALERVNNEKWADVVVIIRGGGSLEDLWAFNDERLAGAIVASRIPVLTGIGHEVDTSIADLVADCRAATPSHAAQLLWQERRWYAQRADMAELALERRMTRVLDSTALRVDSMDKALRWLSPHQRLERMHERGLELARRLETAITTRLTRLEEHMQQSHARLNMALRPENFVRRHEQLAAMDARLTRAVHRHCDNAAQHMDVLVAQLAAYDPHAPLQRGYALVWTEKNGKRQPARGVMDFTAGKQVHIAMHDGEAAATVLSTQQTPSKNEGS